VIVTEVVVVVQMQFRVVIGFALQTSVRRNTGERTEQQQHPFNWRVGWDTRGVAKIKKKNRTKLRSKTEQKRKMKEKV
jgi:hypothetical protein